LGASAHFGFEMGKAAGNLALGKISVSVVHGLQLATVNGYDLALQHSDPAAEIHKLRLGLAARWVIVPSEIRDGLVIENQTTG